eukprot:RCo031173
MQQQGPGNCKVARPLLLKYAKDDAAQPIPTKLAQSLLEAMAPNSVELVDVNSSSPEKGHLSETAGTSTWSWMSFIFSFVVWVSSERFPLDVGLPLFLEVIRASLSGTGFCVR